MARIEGIWIRNFRSLKDVRLGKLWDSHQSDPLTSLTAVIGKNGAGKSALFDAFGFLSDCLKVGVEEACAAPGRGGFDRIRSSGQNLPIEFVINFREEVNSRPITYELSIDLDASHRPFVLLERLLQRRRDPEHELPITFLFLINGEGGVWKSGGVGIPIFDDFENVPELVNILKSSEYDKLLESSDIEQIKLDDNRKLGIATLGSLTQHPRISAFRRFIEGWYLSYFTPDAARSLPLAGPQRRLNRHGDNLGNVVQFMEREHPQKFQSILKRISEKIPGIEKIDTERTSDGRLLLRFNDRGFQDPFYAQQMSDGTLKLFAYLLMLEDPTPPPFLCIEEPENGLYPKLLESLAHEFREYARKGGTQFFVTTHQPYFVDALSPKEVWVLEKKEDGFSTIRRASDDPIVTSMVEQELPLGGLWYSDYLDAR